MLSNKTPKYEQRYIEVILDNVLKEERNQAKIGKIKKNDYLKNGVKACKKLNRKLNRPTLDR